MDHYPRQGEEKFLGTNLSFVMSAAVLKSSLEVGLPSFHVLELMDSFPSWARNA